MSLRRRLLAGGGSFAGPEQCRSERLVVGSRDRHDAIGVGEHALDHTVGSQRDELLARDADLHRGRATEHAGRAFAQA